MQEPFVGVGAEQVGNRDGRPDTRLAQCDIGDLRRDSQAGFDAKAIGKEAEQSLAVRILKAGVLLAPAIELQAPAHDLPTNPALLSRSPTLILSHAAYNNSSERRLSEAAGETVTAPAR